jgi:DNA helicase II / ATP-dependent DNA helicase PcrA
MPPPFSISDDDIAYAEGILLPDGKHFDEERRVFIRNLDTIDLQAVPGSGKTTVLLAKLLILSRKLPFVDGSGILVISHTNAAIEEISLKLQKHCPQLFSYPNFVGTIQGFVDEYLATPYYANKFKRRVSRIDNEIFDEVSEALFGLNLPDFKIQEQANARYFLIGKEMLLKYRFGYLADRFKVLSGLNGSAISISKPRNPRQKVWNDFSDEEKGRVKEWLIAFRLKVWEKGILHYDDAYFLAETYLRQMPIIKSILQKRFSFVFVDEMQDMDKHQYELLEKVFFDEGTSFSKFQRIGDKNQSIYNGDAKLDLFWTDRTTTLNLNGSQRLTLAISDVVNSFALFRPEGFKVIGLREGALNPYIITYDSTSILNVIPRFLLLIQELQAEGKFPAKPDHPIKVIAWNTIWKEGERSSNPNNVRLEDYYPDFSKEAHKSKVDYSSLRDYLHYFDRSKLTLESIRKNLLSALLKVLRLEGSTDEGGKHFTKRRLIEIFKELAEKGDEVPYFRLQHALFEWSMEVIRGNENGVHRSIVIYLPEFLAIFGKSIAYSNAFIEADQTILPDPVATEGLRRNVIHHAGIECEISTVHASKGQTHSATLYLESSYYGDHETNRLHEQFLGNEFGDHRVRHKESTKMAYVGLSRPTTLLCIAIHKHRFEELFSGLDTEKWKVINIQ